MAGVFTHLLKGRGNVDFLKRLKIIEQLNIKTHGQFFLKGFLIFAALVVFSGGGSSREGIGP
jgi:hypothetical protein